MIEAAPSKSAISNAIAQYGVAPGAKWMMKAEMQAAKKAVETGIYAVWRSTKVNGQDCTRIGPMHRCFCSHSYQDHHFASKRSQHMACVCCPCKRFEVVPSRPEEVGAWWLPRRKDFDVRAWRAKCKCSHSHEEHDPNLRFCRSCVCSLFNSDYCCLLCDGAQEDHEVVYESEQERIQAGKPVGEAFYPLAEVPDLQQQVFCEENKNEGLYVRQRPRSTRGRGPRARASRDLSSPMQMIEGVARNNGPSLESLFTSGAISASDYHTHLKELDRLSIEQREEGISLEHNDVNRQFGANLNNCAKRPASQPYKHMVNPSNNVTGRARHSSTSLQPTRQQNLNVPKTSRYKPLSDGI